MYGTKDYDKCAKTSCDEHKSSHDSKGLMLQKLILEKPSRDVTKYAVGLIVLLNKLYTYVPWKH